MRIANFGNSGITWYATSPQLTDPKRNRRGKLKNTELFNIEDEMMFNDNISMLNAWQNKAIARYIHDCNIGSYIVSSVYSKDNMFFGYIDGKLSVVSAVTGHMPINYRVFNEYIESCETGHLQDNPPKFVTYSNALLALKNNRNNNNAHIDYLVVNPNMQGMGLGTNAIKDVIDNPMFFVGHKANVTSATIDVTNTSSRCAFANNNFAMINGEISNYPQFRKHYFVEGGNYDNDFEMKE